VSWPNIAANIESILVVSSPNDYQATQPFEEMAVIKGRFIAFR
jgi:hypothetical protein